MAYMDLKSVYVYNAGDSEKKLNLYKEILNMDRMTNNAVSEARDRCAI